jgi:hypothetical protein
MGTPDNLKKAVIKIMLGMVFLLVFLPQLSYKFYLCANNPSWTFKAQDLAQISHQRAGIRNITFEHCRPLSIDKRYSLKHIVALLPAGVECIRVKNCSPACPARPAPGPDRIPGYVCCLRGPPQAASFS